MCLTLTGALLAAPLATAAYAGGKDHGERRHAVSRYDNRRDHDRRDRRDDRRVVVRERNRYFGARDIVIVRDYYRPHYRPVRGAQRVVYVRNAHLPRGWERRIAPVPVYVERQLVPLPYGYSRGILDGQLVVHDRAGLILDVAVLF
jgi:hypothetical protein